MNYDKVKWSTVVTYRAVASVSSHAHRVFRAGQLFGILYAFTGDDRWAITALTILVITGSVLLGIAMAMTMMTSLYVKVDWHAAGPVFVGHGLMLALGVVMLLGGVWTGSEGTRDAGILLASTEFLPFLPRLAWHSVGRWMVAEGLRQAEAKS